MLAGTVKESSELRLRHGAGNSALGATEVGLARRVQELEVAISQRFKCGSAQSSRVADTLNTYVTLMTYEQPLAIRTVAVIDEKLRDTMGNCYRFGIEGIMLETATERALDRANAAGGDLLNIFEISGLKKLMIEMRLSKTTAQEAENLKELIQLYRNTIVQEAGPRMKFVSAALAREHPAYAPPQKFICKHVLVTLMMIGLFIVLFLVDHKQQ